MIEIKEISSPSELVETFDVRRIVFVIGQNCPPDEEYDEFDATATHLRARYNGLTVGTCRYRKTDFGWKLERFAVLDKYRGKGIGKALVNACLEALKTKGGTIYLHAQTHAETFYGELGFERTGSLFVEAGIDHYKMILNGG